MRKEFGKIVRESFAQRMRNLCPDFVLTKVNAPYGWPGERAFCNKTDASLFCWIVLHPSLKDSDEFTVMVGWSNYGRYPELSVIPSFRCPTPDHAEFSEPEYLVRLPMLSTVTAVPIRYAAGIARNPEAFFLCTLFTLQRVGLRIL